MRLWFAKRQVQCSEDYRDDPDAYAELCLPDKTEHEIREWYRTMWNLSDIEIDERIATRLSENSMSGRK